MHDPETPEHLTKTEARAGEVRNTMRYILVFSLAGIIVLFALIYLFAVR